MTNNVKDVEYLLDHGTLSEISEKNASPQKEKLSSMKLIKSNINNMI